IACAVSTPPATDSPLARYGSKAQFTHFRPLQPDFRDPPACEYRLIQTRGYAGRGQLSHYRWVRVPLEGGPGAAVWRGTRYEAGARPAGANGRCRLRCGG